MTTDRPRRRYLYAGRIFITLRPHLVTTVLGSCVSVCLWDAHVRVGGINHFVAPCWDRKGQPSNRFGDIAIRSLVDKMLKRGTERSSLRAKVFGGGEVLQLTQDFSYIGKDNIRAAMEALAREDIEVVVEDTGGPFGRKLIFNTYEGSVLVKRFTPARGTPLYYTL
jgi:chemotaxis protein CheD